MLCSSIILLCRGQWVQPGQMIGPMQWSLSLKNLLGSIPHLLTAYWSVVIIIKIIIIIIAIIIIIILLTLIIKMNLGYKERRFITECGYRWFKLWKVTMWRLRISPFVKLCPSGGAALSYNVQCRETQPWTGFENCGKTVLLSISGGEVSINILLLLKWHIGAQYHLQHVETLPTATSHVKSGYFLIW